VSRLGTYGQGCIEFWSLSGFDGFSTYDISPALWSSGCAGRFSEWYKIDSLNTLIIVKNICTYTEYCASGKVGGCPIVQTGPKAARSAPRWLLPLVSQFYNSAALELLQLTSPLYDQSWYLYLPTEPEAGIRAAICNDFLD
jgi:hypothetical protein